VVTVLSISPRVQSLSVAMVLLLYKLDFLIEVSMMVESGVACYSQYLLCLYTTIPWYCKGIKLIGSNPGAAS
jgi:hypothetical protein